MQNNKVEEDNGYVGKCKMGQAEILYNDISLKGTRLDMSGPFSEGMADILINYAKGAGIFNCVVKFYNTATSFELKDAFVNSLVIHALAGRICKFNVSVTGLETIKHESHCSAASDSNTPKLMTWDQFNILCGKENSYIKNFILSIYNTLSIHNAGDKEHLIQSVMGRVETYGCDSLETEGDIVKFKLEKEFHGIKVVYDKRPNIDIQDGLCCSITPFSGVKEENAVIWV